jgi:alpha-1,2-mannosyltransferase
MHIALEEFRAHPEAPLYSDVFFRRHIRFPYAPPSLLLTSMVERLPVNEFAVLHFLSWLVLVATVLITVRLHRRGAAGEDRAAATGRLDGVVASVLVAGFTLTFYPVVKGFTLGQIQTWINLSLVGALLSWTRGGEALGGVLAALPCLVKPQYSILLLWGLSRRHWRFCAAFAAMVAGALAVSVATFGWANHRSYLWKLSYVSLHGESYFANHSINGLLQRALFNGENLSWRENAYPPFNPGVYAGTLLAALALIGYCLTSRSPPLKALYESGAAG